MKAKQHSVVNWFLHREKDGVKAGKSTLGPSWHNVVFHAIFRWTLLTSHDAHLPVSKGTECSSWICICFHLQLDKQITLNHKDQMLFSLCPTSAHLNCWAGLSQVPGTAPALSVKDGLFICLVFGCRDTPLVLGCLKCRCTASKCRLQSSNFGGCVCQNEEEGNRESLGKLPGSCASRRRAKP